MSFTDFTDVPARYRPAVAQIGAESQPSTGIVIDPKSLSGNIKLDYKVFGA